MATVPPRAAPDVAADHLDAQLTALRALCQLVAAGGPAIRSGSITVTLGRDGTGTALLRGASRVAAELGVTDRISLEGGRGTIRISRAG